MFRNIDSPLQVVSDSAAKVIVNGWPYSFVHDIPIYLVSRETMDKICPPHWEVGIPSEESGAVAEIIDALNKLPPDTGPDELGRRIDEAFKRIRGLATATVCDGVFIASHNPEALRLGVEPPAIFICPERIKEVAEKAAEKLNVATEEAFDTLLEAVVIHEETHAFTWRVSRGETYKKYAFRDYVRIIEESLAEYSAYANLPVEHRPVFIENNHSKPLEYIAWKAYNIRGALDKSSHSFAEACYWASKLVKNDLSLDLTIPYHPFPSFTPLIVDPLEVLLLKELLEDPWLRHRLFMIMDIYPFHLLLRRPLLRVYHDIAFEIERSGRPKPSQVELLLKIYALSLLGLTAKTS